MNLPDVKTKPLFDMPESYLTTWPALPTFPKSLSNNLGTVVGKKEGQTSKVFG